MPSADNDLGPRNDGVMNQTDRKRALRWLFVPAGLLLATGCGEMEMPPPMQMVDPMVRFGHFLVDVPGFDVCLQADGEATFSGPVMRTALSRMGGVAYAQASGYVTLKPVTYKVRVVSGQAMNCNTALAGVPDMASMQLQMNKRYLFAAMGNPLTTFQAPKVLLVEDDTTVAADKARLRFVHGIEGQSDLVFGTGSGGNFAGQLTAASFGSVGTAAGGTYIALPAATQATWSLKGQGGTQELKVFGGKITLKAGAVYTAVAVGSPQNPASPVAITLCSDLVPAVLGLADCNEIQ